MIEKCKRRLAGEEAFTLIELLIVLIILGILLLIAVPAYIGFKDRAAKTAAQANVREAVAAAEVYYADHGNYLLNTMPDMVTAAPTALAALLAIDGGINLSVAKTTGAGTGYCIQSTVNGFPFSKQGPNGVILAGACP